MRKIALPILLLAGCANGHWERAGTTQSDFYFDKGACWQDAIAAYPDIQPQQTGQTVSCTSYGNSANCNAQPTYARISPLQVLANVMGRNNVFGGCMRAKGYNWQS